jgi:LPXTG-motif cell wall-anchored protein
MDNTLRFNVSNVAIDDMRYNPIEDTDFVYATGGIRRFAKRRRSIADNRRARRDKKVNAKVSAKTGRVSAKQTVAQSKLAAAKSDAAMAKALSSSSPKKSNTGLYIGLGVGALLLVGAAFYFLKKKK